MMAKSFDDLIEFLLGEIALCGTRGMFDWSLCQSRSPGSNLALAISSQVSHFSNQIFARSSFTCFWALLYADFSPAVFGSHFFPCPLAFPVADISEQERAAQTSVVSCK